MRIDFSERSVTLAATELATFRAGPPPRKAAVFEGRWRAEAGQHWHRALRDRLTAEISGDSERSAAFEVPLDGSRTYLSWHFTVQGRIDQVVRGPDSTLVREVKTVRRALPLPVEDIEADYAEYLDQAAVYSSLLPVAEGPSEASGNSPVETELVLVDIDHGLTQVHPVRECAARFEACLNRLTQFLEARRAHSARIRGMDFRPPFATPRPGQETTAARLCEALDRAPVTLFEAPTGFGKTGVALQLALDRLRDGLVDRVVYLTGKSTGQLQVCKQLAAMRSAEAETFNYLQMRSRLEHGPGATPPDLHRAVDETGVDPPSLFHAGTVDLAATVRHADLHQLPPYELTRALLRWADIWVADYNYIFSPRHAGVFLAQPGFDPRRTFLVVDEAHNLPGRAAEGWSAAFAADALHFVAGELAAAFPLTRLPDLLDELARECERFPRQTPPPPDAAYAFTGAIEAVVDHLRQGLPPMEEISDLAREILWDLLDTERLRDHRAETLVWSPAKGAVRITCLDAAPFIAESIRSFGHALFMSATLRPFDNACRALGLDPAQVSLLEAEAPWRAGSFDVAIDARVDTSLRQRPRSQPHTAHTVRRLVAALGAPAAVFFPSYKYAGDIARLCQTFDPGFDAALPPRGLSLAEQHEFIEESLIRAHALFLVLGTGFAEGIDLLGGRIGAAMVVGPALPEVNALQEARRDAARHLGAEAAFHHTYRIPGMTKVNQAIGRLVRAPGQRVRLLLHCRRFAEPAFRDLIDPACAPVRTLRDDDDFAAWLHGNTAEV
ncbi:MAG: hypothetical protein JJU00_13840 [Opitutales bacterium]|nr:hypothetical protein [Opitutales bacterium]